MKRIGLFCALLLATLALQVGFTGSADAASVRTNCKSFGGKIIKSATKWITLNTHVTMKRKGSKVCVAFSGPGDKADRRVSHRWVTTDGICRCTKGYESVARDGNRTFAVVFRIGHRVDDIVADTAKYHYEPSTTAC